MVEQIIYLINNDHVNLKNVEAFVTLLEEAYGDPDHMNTTEWVLGILCQHKQDFIIYYA
jgi:hypothetical protein